MMKTGGLKRGSRKKHIPELQQLQSQPPQYLPDPPSPKAMNPSLEGPRVQYQQHDQAPLPPQQQQQQQQQQVQAPNLQPIQMRRSVSDSGRQGPSQEHLDLTKKNYRLAKELSELRVRHRDECKNVTRLTMENMNLASRCREAISHAAMLKKELAMHQKRAQDAIKFQREQTQRMASNLSAEVSKLSGSYSETDSASSTPDRREMDRILATPPPPPPPRKIASNDPAGGRSQSHGPPVTEPRDDFGNVSTESSEGDDTVYSVTRQGRSVLDVVESLSESSPLRTANPFKDETPSPPPRMYSTPNRHRKEDRWMPNIHDDPGNVDTEERQLFPTSASPIVPKYDDEFPSEFARGASHGIGALSHYPGNYGHEEGPQSGPTLLDRHSGFITMNSIDAFEASFDTTFPISFSTSRRSVTEAETYNPFDASPARPGKRDTQPFVPHSDFSTPPKDRSTNADSEPARPQKTPSNEARSRYEKAMQSRSQELSVSTTDAVAPEKERHGFLGSSPAKFLNRMHLLRKSKDETPALERSFSDGSPSDSSRKQENVSPTAPPEGQLPRKALDDSAMEANPNTDIHARPGGVVARLNTLKQKRAVKQPISYAEPPLNTKIRQGHTNFAKGPLHPVTPERVSNPNWT